MRKRTILILILSLVIGFASVATNLIINGALKVGYNNEDFSSSIIYTRSETSDGTAEINNTGKNIYF